MKSSRARICIALLVGLLAATAAADSWLPARRAAHVSADGQWRLTVDPRPITSPIDYFRDKVDGKANAGAPPGEPRSSAIGTMERKEGRNWRQVWREPLRNEIAPVDALAISGGGAATFDNWHSMGFGKNVVVIYDADGRVLASHALADFLPREYVRALPRSVSSLHWRGEPRVSADGRVLTVPVTIPADRDPEDNPDEHRFVDMSFDLATGQPLPPHGPAWEQALREAHAARQRQIVREEESRQKFTSPLLAPTSGLERDWNLYLIDAFFRLAPNRESEYPGTTVLGAPGASDYNRSLQRLKKALVADGRALPSTRMLGSPSPQNLAEVLVAEAASLKVGSLRQQTIFIALPDELYARASAALSHTGATLKQLDPAKGIAQRPERLERLDSREDDAEDW